MLRGFILALWLVGVPASAQTMPSETPVLPDVSSEDRRSFQVCRAAIFYHLTDRAEHDRVPRAVASAMLEQMSFVMSETLSGTPRSMAEGRTSLDFAESFFITFAAIIAEHRHFGTDVADREDHLLRCQPLLWSLVAEKIDDLMANREAR